MRTVYQDGTCQLIVQFTDGNGDPINPTGGVLVSIFPPDYPPWDPNTVDGDAEVLDAVPTKVTGEVGLYYYNYVTNPTTETGTWYDRWESTVDGEALETNFEFTVLEKVNMASLELGNNMMVRVVLDESIMNENDETLDADYEFFFSTPLDPMYASSDLLALEIGAYIPDISEFALDLAIHWASVQCSAQIFPKSSTIIVNQTYFSLVKTEYVLARAGCMLLNNVLATVAKSKTLADLQVVYDTGAKDKLKELSARCSELRRLLNAGGTLSEGSSLPMQATIRGINDVDRPTFGRDWDKVEGTRGGANSRATFGGRRAKRYWSTDDDKS
jgi:hypothetical protein